MNQKIYFFELPIFQEALRSDEDFIGEVKLLNYKTSSLGLFTNDVTLEADQMYSLWQNARYNHKLVFSLYQGFR